MTFVPAGSKDKDDGLIPPIESYKVLPDWYKDLAKYKAGTSHSLRYLNPINDRGSDGSDVSTKLCVPFMDAMTAGYMYLLEDDVHVSIGEYGLPEISWESHRYIMDSRPTLDQPVPTGCHPIQVGVKMNWYYESEPGYSVLITHPLNRHDLPFVVPSGIVDSDIWGLPVFIPFFIKKDFEGTIKKGTPIFQIIPIKREPWELEIDKSEEAREKHKVKEEARRSHITAHYRKATWQKKIY